MRPLPFLITCLCIVCFAGSPIPARTQDRQDYHFRYVTLDSLVKVVEKKTGYRFYYSKNQTDTLLLSVRSRQEEIIPALNRALLEAGFFLSPVGENGLAITKGQELLTSLPSEFYKAGEDNKADFENGSDIITANGSQVADSENRLYTLGNPEQAEMKGSVRLTGYIRDETTSQPAAGISIYTEDKKYHAISDAYGFYSLSLPRGYATLIIQGFGYKDSHRLIRIFSESSLDINIAEEVYSLSGIVISAEKMENVRNVQLGVEKVRADRIRHIPMAFGEADIIKVVLTLPGVKSVGEASGGFNVRGGASDQNLILFNDGTIFNSAHLFGLFSLFNNDIVSSLELYKSSIPARYGGRISSVLEVNSREGNKNKITGSAGIGLLTTKITLEGPVVKDKTSFILAGRTTYSDWLLGLIPENSGYNNGSANFYDLNAGISHKFNENNHLYVNGYFSRDRFSFNNENSYAYQNVNTSVKFRSILSDNSTMVLSAAYDRYNYRTRDTSLASNAYDLAYKLQQISAKADFTTRLGIHHKLNYGVNAFLYYIHPGTYTPFGEASLVEADILEREQALESALYISDTWEINPNLSFELGLRYGLYSALGPKNYYLYQAGVPRSEESITETVNAPGGKFIKPYHGPELRLSVRYAFTPTFSVKAGFNSMRQNIHMLSNTTIISPTDIWKLSDANIKPQQGWQAAAGLYKNLFDNTLECSIEGYYKNISNYLDYASSAKLLMNHHIETDVIETQGKAYGVEVMLKRSLGRLNGWLSYTYSRTLLRQNDPSVPNPVNNGQWYPAAYDKPHDVKFVGNFKITHRFSFSMNLDYSTGRPITLPVGSYYYSGGWRLMYSDRNAHRIPDYFRMDLSFNIEPSHKLTLLTHSSVTIGVYNVTGRKNPYSVFFKSDGHNNVNSYMLSIFGCPIPYITYNIKF